MQLRPQLALGWGTILYYSNVLPVAVRPSAKKIILINPEAQVRGLQYIVL